MDMEQPAPRDTSRTAEERAAARYWPADLVARQELAPAEEMQADKPRPATAQDIGEAAGNVVGFVILLLLFIGGVSWLASGDATAFFTWAGKTLAGWLS